MQPRNAAPARPLPAFARITTRIWVKTYRAFVSGLWPFADLSVRLLVAQFFLRSGLVKLANWETAVALARNEYPVSWMAPEHAALLGVSIEIVGPLLLIAGLLTRPAAFAMATLLAVSQAVYVPTTTNLFLIALLGWYVAYGAGGLSLDRAFSAGFRHSALPLAKPVATVGECLTRFVAPLWLLLIRLWFAATLLLAIGLFEAPIWLATWLPIQQFTHLPALLAVAIAVLLIVGMFVPVAALLLALATGTLMAMGLHADILLYPMLLYLVLGLRGGGALALDNAISAWLERSILFDLPTLNVPDDWPHVVVVGGGFGGLSCVAALRKLPVRVTLVDKHNYHLFQPLLYQVATASLSPADIAMPIRTMFRGDANVRVVMREVTDVDPAQKTVRMGAQSLDYDWLVLATGVMHSYFGKDEWAPFAPGLKSIEDGTSVRARVLAAFENAESESDPARIDRLLTLVIVGAGPTGVELAGAIAELAHNGLRGEYRNIDPGKARIVLVQSGDRVLPAFPEELSGLAQQSLERLGVEVLLGSRVTDIGPDAVQIGDDKTIATENVFWAAGVIASPAGRWLDAETDRAGRVEVDEHLRVPGCENVFVIGDTAASSAWDGDPVPGLAPAAKQAGSHVSSYIRSAISDKTAPGPFRYRHQGSLATIGRKSAVADFGWTRLHGAVAWWLWGAVHVGFLAGMRNRAAVLVNWVWNYFTMRLGIRLITGKSPHD